MPHLVVSRLLLPGFVVLILNSAYLVAAPTASLWYYANVVAHPLLGIALALAVGPRVLCAANGLSGHWPWRVPVSSASDCYWA